MKKLVIIAALFFALPFSAQAQIANCRVTTSAPSYNNNSTAPLSCDTDGNLRTAGGGSSGSDVNLTGINGNPPSATNPLYVAPATAVNPWPVSGTVAVSGISGTVAVTQSTSPWVVNTTQLGGNSINLGSGNIGTGTQRVVGATDSPAIANKGEGATGATAPTGAQLAGVQSGANMVALLQASSSVAISVSTATTTQLVALSGSTKIYVTSFDVIAGGTGNFQLVYGTGTNCGTGTTSLTGAYNLTAQAGIAKGNGLGPVLVVPSGNALCVTTSAAVQMSGSVSYTQF